MKKQSLVSLTACSLVAAVTFGSVAHAAVTFGSVAHAADNPFAAKQLQAGYQLAQADKKMDGKCGEAKCGAEKQAMADKKKDGKCGEAKCGADKRMEKKADGSCGAGKKGEASCGAKK